MSRLDPRGAIVVVTGAGSGIGAATARRFASLGAKVVVVDINEETAQETATACGGTAFRCDVGDVASVTELAKQVKAQVGPVDILVNNAGVGLVGPFIDATLDDWTWLRSVNIDGVVNCCRIFGEDMVERQRGQVVNIASGAGYFPTKHLSTYSASKSFVIMLSRCLRADWAKHNIGVSVVCPSVTNSGIHTRSRLYGETINNKNLSEKFFTLLGHSPDSVAKTIVGAAVHNRGVVPSGIENKLGYQALRVIPDSVLNLIARMGPN